MEFSEENYSIDEEDNFQPTLLETNAESVKEIPIKANYKKWINSKSEISHISSIVNLEIESSYEKNSTNFETNQKDVPNTENKKDKNEYENLIPKETKEESKIIDKNFTFVWSEGGNNVKITGSFCDWKIRYDMIKDLNDNKFKYQLPLDNKAYQFKFIVDDQWKYSSTYPTQKDELGNINNSIDLTNYFPKDKEENISSKENPTIKEKEKEEIAKVPCEINKEDKKIRKRKESIYDSEYPSDDNIIPMSLPNKRYFQSFKLDKYSHQNSIGDKKYYSYYKKNSFSGEASSKPIFLLGHINLNHLISFKNKKINVKNCMSFRYREKACTFLYYK